MTTDRLRSQYPSVAVALDAIPQGRLGDVVRVVAAAAAEACDLADESQRAADASALVAELDEAAWTAQDSGDNAPYERAFRRARAADAWVRSMVVRNRESAGEAIYEAIHAFGGDAAAEARVARLVRS